MTQKSRTYIKTGDYPIIDEWVNNTWPATAKEAIRTCGINYRKVIKFRTSTGKVTISRPIADSFQLVLNYNSAKKCFVVWNAAIQKEIHHGKKMRLSIGCEGDELLRKPIAPNSVTSCFREIGRGRDCAGCVELILIIGQDALPEFFRQYNDLLVPNRGKIPKGKTCLYARAGGKIEYILAE